MKDHWRSRACTNVSDPLDDEPVLPNPKTRICAARAGIAPTVVQLPDDSEEYFSIRCF